MEDMTEAVREALQGVTYGDRNVPHLDSPKDDSPHVTTLITDPAHCTARHTHHDFQSVVASAMCGLVGQVPDGMFLGTFTHLPTPVGAPAGERDETWIYREELDDQHKQGALFLAMAGWMTLAKMVDELKNNYIYVEKRWRAAVTGLGLTDKVCHTSKKDLLLSISEEMNKSREVKSKFIKMFIALESSGDLPLDTVRAAIISQIKMVWEFHGLCSYRLMDQMIFVDSPILGIETIAREACAFKEHYDSLQNKMGVHFPYAGVLRLVPADISISKYPNLYLVAISHAKSTGSLTNFRLSTNVKASVPVKVLSKAVRGMSNTTVVSEGSLRDLAAMGLVTTDGKELKRRARIMISRRRQKETDSEDESDDATDQAGPSKRRR